VTEPRPRHLASEYGAQFADASVVPAYEHRPPYPDEVYEVLLGLLGPAPCVLVDLGCGPGEITRRMAPRVEEIHPLDAWAPMIERPRVLVLHQPRLPALRPGRGTLGEGALRGRRPVVRRPVLYRQPLDQYVESWHSRNGLSRERMGDDLAREFDLRVKDALARHTCGSSVEFPVEVRMRYG
jgi:hypothetical protein